MTLFYANQYVTTQLSQPGGISDTDTTNITLQDDTGLDTTNPGIALLDYQNPLDVTKAEWITYTSINASKILQGVVRGQEGSIARAHSDGCSIAFPISKSHINNINRLLRGVDSGAILNTPTIKTWDGWINADESWSYASATTITVPSGATSKYRKGDKIKLTQTTVKYFYVVGVADTVLTVTGGSDYSVANAAITENYYSHASSPIGFPTYHLYTPSWTADTGVAPSLGNGSIGGLFHMEGNMVFCSIKLVMGSTTTYGSGGNVYKFSVPVPSSLSLSGYGNMMPMVLTDTSGYKAWSGYFDPNSLWSYGHDSTQVYVYANYPFTWASTDVILINGVYICA